MPVFWGRDAADQMIPADLVARTGAWLREASGAHLEERLCPGLGHGIAVPELTDASAFLRRAWADGA
ncbi:hypothetical protein [Streptomyces fungicidicus]|uniref:hypothetical protein n=1 Tax=Streptomyces fungicidicus TaxID=68203 RepID=UPI003D71A745